MDVEFLKIYLEYKGIPFKDELGRVRFCAPSMENQNKTISYTCYYNNHTTVQYKSTKREHDFNTIFWFIHSLEVPVRCNDAQEKAIRAARIFREYWNLKFNDKTEWGVKFDAKTSTEPVQAAPGSEPSSQSVNTDELIAEVKVLRGTVEKLTSMVATLMKHLNCGVATADVITTSDKGECKSGTQTDILNRILEHSQPLSEQKRYKSITLEQIAKENKPERKKDIQQAYDILKERRLLTAKYRPHGDWKFDFQRKSIELLFRVDKRASAVYNTRHRPLNPRVIDGKVLKEEATEGEKYLIPYGLEKIDYSYKTIFVTEGIYDSCFLKNCLAYSNWILPTEMSKVIDIYREAGFQIIHILDNFRLGDKGGLKGLYHVKMYRDWLSKGDKVFSWGIYSEFKDFNDVAIEYGLDEIDAQTIIDNSWNEDEVRANCDKHFSEWLEVCRKKCSKEEWEKFAPSVGLSCKVTAEEPVVYGNLNDAAA